jgi:hypothetical protein
MHGRYPHESHLHMTYPQIYHHSPYLHTQKNFSRQVTTATQHSIFMCTREAPCKHSNHNTQPFPSHRCTITTHTHTHICPPTQINTNNDEGGIQRLGITVRKCEILHPHNKICFHTTKHVIDSQKHEIFHRHKKYVTKRTRNFSSTHSSTNYCAVPRTVLNHTLTGDSLLHPSWHPRTSKQHDERHTKNRTADHDSVSPIRQTSTPHLPYKRVLLAPLYTREGICLCL